ncbi:MAG: malto-oligosyltrehalose synthase, partial [Pseudomonadota bacterium]
TFSKLYYKFAGLNRSYEDLVAEKKRLIIGKHMAGNIDNLAQQLKNISSNDRNASDITLYGIERVLVEVFAFFPVYRTYVNSGKFSDSDKLYIKEAIDKAKEKSPFLMYELDYLQKFLLLENIENIDEESKKSRLNFIMNFQQYTGPLMAKGFEDTVLYIYNRLISLNEVGGHPIYFGVPRKEFHSFCKGMSEKLPHSMNATSTHDTKRGEDVRARINVLSEMPREWAGRVKMWNKLNKKNKKKIGEGYFPDNNDEYFIYQTLIGVYPFDEQPDIFKERVKEYLIKAVREAKVHTAWIKNDTDYESACVNFIEQILKEDDNNQFLKDFLPFQKKAAFYGTLNSLSQAMIKMTAPGVPDFYQGCELWELNLVDPDNRRPVDYDKRISMLADIKERSKNDINGLLKELSSDGRDGKIKLYLIYKTLEFRKAHPDIFETGSYVPIETTGKLKDNVISFMRKSGKGSAVVIAPRFYSYFMKEGEMVANSDIWGDTSVVLPEGSPAEFKDILTGNTIKCSDNTIAVSTVQTLLPVSLLYGAGSGHAG